MGWEGVPLGVRISCDTLDQLKSLAEQGNVSMDAFGAKYKEYHGTTGDKGDPMCVVGTISVVVTIADEVDLGISFMEGHPEHIWALRIKTDGSDWWLFDEEKLTNSYSETPA